MVISPLLKNGKQLHCIIQSRAAFMLKLSFKMLEHHIRKPPQCEKKSFILPEELIKSNFHFIVASNDVTLFILRGMSNSEQMFSNYYLKASLAPVIPCCLWRDLLR